MPRRSKQPEKAERALIEQLQRVQAEASLARVASAAKGDQPAMTLRLESMVTSGALEATSSSKAGDGVAAIPASKTYMSLVAEKFYRRVMPAIDPRCKHNFTNPKKNKGIAYKLFLFFTQVAPNSKPIARDAQNFMQVYTPVAKAVGTMQNSPTLSMSRFTGMSVAPSRSRPGTRSWCTTATASRSTCPQSARMLQRSGGWTRTGVSILLSFGAQKMVRT
mmetsp:Transcript_77484/g.199481  ORF Transcript_77484/g.199481 Transcript_77484/m.199481 type:complete len:220 (+) Transcript_77484:58-717(+)